MPAPVLFSSVSAEEHLEYWRNQHPRPESYVYVLRERTRHHSPVKTRFVEPEPVPDFEVRRREEIAAFGYVRSDPS